jgi:hypothetical protein
MPQFHLHVTPHDADKVSEVMLAVNRYKAEHPGMSQFGALAELIFLGQVLSKKQAKEKEEREEKKIRLTRSDGRRGE